MAWAFRAGAVTEVALPSSQSVPGEEAKGICARALAELGDNLPMTLGVI